MALSDFIHLRVHSAYSLAEGAIKPKDLIKLCTSNNMPAVAVTDTNNMFGAADFTGAAKGAGIQPIIGAQISIPVEEKEVTDKFAKPVDVICGQLVLLSQTETGYKNLMKILSKAHLNTPPGDEVRVLWRTLEKHNEGLILLTGGAKGPIGKLLLENQVETAKEKLKGLKDIFGDRVYVELQRHGLEIEERVEKQLIDFAYELEIPLVATNEVFFKTKKDYRAHDALLCIAAGRYIDEDDRRKETQEHYFKSAEEMKELFKDLPEAIENTINIAKRCGYMVPLRPPLLPKAYDNGVSEADIIREQSVEGLKKRIAHLSEEEQKPYFERLEFELGVILQMGFPGYFLIVSDFIKWSKENDIPVGPGRGSGAGSVVAWSLSITDLDPLRYGLLFERFLNPDRVSMPDFDVDFCQTDRDKVIHYVQEKYGADKVAQIITFGELKAKAVVRDVGRVLRMPYGQVDRISKLIPFDPKMTLERALEESAELRQMRETEEVVGNMINIALQLEGLMRHASTHACGMVIGDRSLTELTALYRDPKSDMPVTQYNVKYIEDTGLIKFDFLGLKTLSVIKSAVKMIQKSGGEKIDMDHLELEDEKTFKLFSRGDTIGVFQFESSGMRDVLFNMQPSCIEDIIAAVALYRPGPMENIPTFNARKHGAEPIEYMHPDMAEYLEETYGIIVYQEQVMQLAQKLAGYTKGMADDLRKAMGKKIAEKMEKHHKIFLEGAIKYGIEERLAEEIFQLMAKFASYGFNKSHAACYAVIAYQTAYLKAHHRAELTAASMSFDLNNTDKLQIFYQDAKKGGLKILPPDVNQSEVLFDVQDGNIRYALAAIKNVGEGAMEALVAERNENGLYKNIPDFISRMDNKLMNKRLFENLIKAGAFDSMEPNRAKLLENADILMDQAVSEARERDTNQSNLFDLLGGGENATGKEELPTYYQNLKVYQPYSLAVRLQKELEAIGFYISAHPLDKYAPTLKKSSVVSSDQFNKMPEGNIIKTAAIIDNIREMKTKKGRDMAVLMVSDMENSFDVLVFEDVLHRTKEKIKKDNAVIITGKIVKDGDISKLFVQNLEGLEDFCISVTNHFILNVSHKKYLPDIARIMEDCPPGTAHITLKIPTDQGVANMVLPKRYRLTPEVYEGLKELLGEVILD